MAASAKKGKDSLLDSFWKLLQRKKYTAASRAFRSDKQNIFHDLSSLHELASCIQSDSEPISISNGVKYQEYFVQFLLNNGLLDFMRDASNSRRWNDDAYHANIMLMYELLAYLMNHDRSQLATQHNTSRQRTSNIFSLLVNTMDVSTILGYPYLDRHLDLFWHYFISNQSSMDQEAIIHSAKLEHLLCYGFDSAMENIYVAMHSRKNQGMLFCRRYRGRILQILCTVYHFFSDHLNYQHKLENKQNIMEFILSDYFLLNFSYCNDHFLHSTENAVAKFIAHSYNFGFFMHRIVELFKSDEGATFKQQETMTSYPPEFDIDAQIVELERNINGKKHKSVINTQNMYRLLIPLELMLQNTFSRSSYRKTLVLQNGVAYFIQILITALQSMPATTTDRYQNNQIVCNRFLYVVDAACDVNKKLGRYLGSDGEVYSKFEIIACHLMQILLQNYVICYSQYTKTYSLQRSRKEPITQLLHTLLSVLQNEQENKGNDDDQQKAANAAKWTTPTTQIQSVMQALCNEHQQQYVRNQKRLPRVDEEQIGALKAEITRLNMSFVGPLPLNVLDSVINYHQRTLLVDYCGHSSVFPMDVHRMIVAYCDSFRYDAAMNAIKPQQIVLFDKLSMKDVPTLIVDAEYVFNAQWIICRVERIIYGPMNNVTHLLVTYKISANNYGYLCVAVQQIEWVQLYRCWRQNVIYNLHIVEHNPALQCIMQTDLQMSLFQSWCDTFVSKWIKDETKYKQQQQDKLRQLKDQQNRLQAPTRTRSKYAHLTVHAKGRQSRSQRRK